MNILHMKYAVEVARLGSLNKAAETLLIAQPNISRSIKELEADLGISIFTRSAKGMELTPEGEEFIDYAKSILKQIADCKPDAIHSLDPQGGVNLIEARKIVGDNIALCGNVNCGLLQTGTEEEARLDTIRALEEGMSSGKGFIFCTSNCAYTGMPLDRYELMNNIWRERGNYDLK